VGLLTAPITLVRAPVRLTLRVWEFGLSSAAEAARIGLELLDPDRGAQPDHAARGRPEQANGYPPYVDVAEPEVEVGETEVEVAETEAQPDAPPSVPDELVPDHVDEEPVLVAEAAEAGAEEGAGPEFAVEPPWDGYDQMSAADIADRLAVANPAEAAAVELYESTSKNRSSVLEAAERALRG
jgi:hypothetical protein